MKWFRIEPRFLQRNKTPRSLLGVFSFSDAHRVCCDWNARHDPQEMMIEVEIDMESAEEKRQIKILEEQWQKRD